MSAPAKPRPITSALVVTANTLRDGRVTWLAADRWTPRLAEARIFPAEQAEAALALGQAAERAELVVGAYAVEVEVKAGRPLPRRYRERLRAEGPSVDAEPKPAAQEAA